MGKSIKEIIEAEYGTNIEEYKDEVSTLYSVNNYQREFYSQLELNFRVFGECNIISNVSFSFVL
jgi:hypothetical protein